MTSNTLANSFFDIVSQKQTSATLRFWSRVEKTEGCWIWKGNILKDGYGRFGHVPQIMAHRAAYELVKGKIPEGMTLDHTCHNPDQCNGGYSCPHRACVNPDHLEPVTLQENILRGNNPSAINKRKTHCSNGHPLIEGNLSLWDLKNGRRKCIICKNITQIKYQNKPKEGFI